MDINRKLEHMTHTVLNDALRKRHEIIEKSKKVVEDALKEAEIRALKASYEKIQEETHKSQREKQEKISNASIEAKKQLIKRRDELEQQIVENVTKRIYEYKKSGEYKNWVLGLVNEAKKLDENIIVYLDKSDEGLMDDLGVKNVVLCDEGFIGGARICVPSKNYVIDHTYMRALNEQIENFNALRIDW
ncbi:MAG: hypothetical protein GX196_05775 [Clostridiaceae bacterium]|nr:hypothetical protein [Clostridiaceae bacterium]